MDFPNFDPVIFSVGPFALRWYALAYVAGILLGWRYAVMLVNRPAPWAGGAPSLTVPQIDDLVLWVTLGVIGGGRLGYVLFYQPSLLWPEPWQALYIWEGGMSFHGGLLGVALAMWLFARAQKIAVLRVADLVAAVVPIGLFFGRIANFINGELYGRPTDAPWGVVFCNTNIIQTLGYCPAGGDPRHPSQLYEAFFEGLLLFALLSFVVWRLKWLRSPGAVTGLFLLGYGVSRVVLENFREPDAFMPDMPLGLTMGILLSVPMVLAGGWLLWRARADLLPRREP